MTTHHENMYGGTGTTTTLDNIAVISNDGDVNETPFNVFIGHNLGHRVFTMSISFRKFKEISAVANDRENGPVAQRPLDENHAKKLAVYMLKGLVSAAKIKYSNNNETLFSTFDEILGKLGEQPYFSLQPIVCNIRNTEPGGKDLRGIRLESQFKDTASFRVFLSEKHILWVVDGQHRRHAADQALTFLEEVRHRGKYPSKGAVLFPEKGKAVSEQEMKVWNYVYEAARGFATLTIEVHLGLDISQERQLFHDLNRLAKKVESSLALQFDSSNPVMLFIKRKIIDDLGVQVTDRETKDWTDDSGALSIKDVVAINSIAFLNKSNIAGATPAVTDAREDAIINLWGKITEIPDFGSAQSKEKTVAAQSVVLKALAKLAFDLNFSNRRPENAKKLYEQLLEKIPEIDFSHKNPMWRYYSLSEQERLEYGLHGLNEYLPEDPPGVNRDIGNIQGNFMRFGVKHNDIYPIISDMIRWSTQLPSRRSE